MLPRGLVISEQMTLVRDALAASLAMNDAHGSIRTAASMTEAISHLDDDAACILLLDLGLLGPAGLAAITALRARFPHTPILALAARETRDGLLQTRDAGAHGCIAKTATFTELTRAIEALRSGGTYVPPSLALAAAEAPVPDVFPAPIQLTGRQRDVLRLLAEGRSTKDIARTLDLAVSTIKVHLAAVYRTVGARNRVEALNRAGFLARAA